MSAAADKELSSVRLSPAAKDDTISSNANEAAKRDRPVVTVESIEQPQQKRPRIESREIARRQVANVAAP